MNKEQLICPKCQSDQLTSNQKGFNNTTAALGMLTGGVVQGMGYGMIDSGKILITCLKCGHKYEPGKGALKITNEETGDFEIIYQHREESNAGKQWFLFFFVIFLIVMAGWFLDFIGVI